MEIKSTLNQLSEIIRKVINQNELLFNCSFHFVVIHHLAIASAVSIHFFPLLFNFQTNGQGHKSLKSFELLRVNNQVLN